MKICRKCLHSKPLSDFCKDKTTKDGLARRCKKCLKASTLNWKRTTGLKKSREYMSVYLKDYFKHYWKDNPEKHERVKAQYRLRAKLRPKYIENAMSSCRRAQKLKATPLWADKKKIAALYERASILGEQTGKCYHVDHIVPLRGYISRKHVVCGLHTEDNLQIIVSDENQKKSNVVWPLMPG